MGVHRGFTEKSDFYASFTKKRIYRGDFLKKEGLASL